MYSHLTLINNFTTKLTLTLDYEKSDIRIGKYTLF